MTTDRPLVLPLCYRFIAILMCLGGFIASSIVSSIASFMASLDILGSFMNDSLVLILLIFALQQTLNKSKYIKTVMRY